MQRSKQPLFPCPPLSLAIPCPLHPCPSSPPSFLKTIAFPKLCIFSLPQFPDLPSAFTTPWPLASPPLNMVFLQDIPSGRSPGKKPQGQGSQSETPVACCLKTVTSYILKQYPTLCIFNIVFVTSSWLREKLFNKVLEGH